MKQIKTIKINEINEKKQSLLEKWTYYFDTIVGEPATRITADKIKCARQEFEADLYRYGLDNIIESGIACNGAYELKKDIFDIRQKFIKALYFIECETFNPEHHIYNLEKVKQWYRLFYDKEVIL